MSSLEILNRLRRELRDKGMERKDIEKALRLMLKIETFDRAIFPDSPAPFELIAKKNPKGDFAGYYPRTEKQEEHYGIYVKGLLEALWHEKRVIRLFVLKRGKPDLSKAVSLTWGQLLTAVSAHEVRHRLQYEGSVRKFSKEDAGLVDDRLLRAVIKFCQIEFEEREKIYIRDNEPVKYIKEKLSSREFDASIVERFIASKIHQGAGFEEVVLAIKLSAP